MIKNNTPIEKYEIQGIPVFVKREDLCGPLEAPPFSKIRGVYKHLEFLKSQGITTVGYTETSISMAGWAVAWICSMLDMKAVIFNPIYKEEQPVLNIHQEQWKKWGAEIIDIKAGMAKVNWYISKNILKGEYGEKSILLPLGLPLVETIIATKNEARLNQNYSSIVVNIGSGTICAGLVRGFEGRNVHIYGIMGRTGNIKKKKEKICPSFGLWETELPQLTIIDPGYEYTDKVEIKAPFPCNKYYDAKALLWLMKNVGKLRRPILFWNIGANSDRT